MKNIINAFCLLGIILLLSCEDNISPYGDLREKTILNCILNDEDEVQTATVTESYLSEFGALQSGSGDYSLAGVDITIAYEDSAKTLSEISVIKSK